MSLLLGVRKVFQFWLGPSDGPRDRSCKGLVAQFKLLSAADSRLTRLWNNPQAAAELVWPAMFINALVASADR